MPGIFSPFPAKAPFGVGTMLLLTDATVMAQEGETQHWWKLTPDITGSYINGKWTPLADGPNGPLYFASAVLRDGRVFVAGGEYNFGVEVDLLAAEIYDPRSNSWTTLPTPPGWTNIGDAPCCVLPDGRVMLGYLHDRRTAIYDPATNTWAAGADKLFGASSTEETWTLLPDETILVCDCSAHPATEKYVIAAGHWVSCGVTPTDLVEASSVEIGPAILLPDGRLFAIGATGQTALYTMPPIASQAGAWAHGPVFPVVAGKQLGAKDAPAVLLPNGLVLCAVGPVDGVSADYLSPTYFFEFDPLTNLLAPTGPVLPTAPYVSRFLLLPTGQALFADGSNQLQIYTPSGAPDTMWLPSITSAPASVTPGLTYPLHGRQINGLSQAVSYGDDATMATNYPIVQIRASAGGHVYSCRTFGHSSMGVNTGTVIHETQFTVAPGTPAGPAELVVIANGIASHPVGVTVT